MSRQLELDQEVRQARREKAIARAVEYGLVGALGNAGADLLGFTVRLSAEDCLMTLRVKLDDRRQVAFIGGETLGGCFLKAARDARDDKLTWREDKYIQ